MNKKIAEFMSQMEKTSGVSRLELQKIEAELGFKFPDEYADFLLESNGAEGAIGKAAYLVLWPLENIGSLNQMHEVEKDAPNLILFGSDGGGMAFAFDKRFPFLPVVEISYTDIGLEEPEICGRSFSEFLEYMYNRWQD